MIGISRYEYKRSRGWLARYYTAAGTLSQQLFSDSRYGCSEVRSNAAAKRWLAAQACLHAPRMRIQSGRGICLRHKKERNHRSVLVFDVSYTVGGRRKTKSFRVHHYPSQSAAYYAALTFRQYAERYMREEAHRHRQAMYVE